MTRRNSKDADARWSREEGMRTLRWAVEKALDPDDDTSEVGWAIIGALGESGLLQPADLVFLDAVVNAKIGGTMQVLPAGDSKSAVDVLVEESEGE